MTLASSPTEALSSDKLALVQNGRPAVKIIMMVKNKPSLLMKRAADSITSKVTKWSGVNLDVEVLHPADIINTTGPAVVLATLDSLQDLSELESLNPGISRAACMDDQGFVCVPVSGNQVYIVSKTDRGVYNGAVYAGDFMIDGPKDSLSLKKEPVFHNPWMQGRPVYLLSIWDHEQFYTVKDWKTILDSFARDGFSSVYFWMSGHFPSKKFPQTYKWKDGPYDTVEHTKIGTLKDLREIIRYGQDLGLMMYIGGGLGGWTGTGNLTNQEPGTMKTGEGIASYSLCPSNQKSRRALIDYYKEIIDALPQADGLYIEMADEWGECTCPQCHKPVDNLGSRKFGWYQLTLIHEMAREIWKDHPRARFALTNGYAEHAKDPAFYEMIRQMSDPRFEWMEARGSWQFPDLNGEPKPATYFTRKEMKWHIWETRPLDEQIATANKVAKEGWYGIIADFSPGFCSGSFYTFKSDKKGFENQPLIPFPTDILPHVLTYFVTREITWAPTLSLEGVKDRVQRRFFGSEAPQSLSEDLWSLREIIREASAKGSLSEEQKTLLQQIDSRTDEASKNASPKTMDGLQLIKRAIKDLRAFFS